MQEKYLNLVKKFKQLDIEEKQEEILKNLKELLHLLYITNKKLDEENNVLGILKNYNDEDSYYDVLFTYIISLKEENAKLINNLNN